MSEVTVINGQINANVSPLAQARDALFNGLVKTGEVLSNYAEAMNTAFGVGWWDAKGEVKKMVKAEHAQFIAEGETKLKWSRSQIDTYWSRVKDAAGRVKAQNKVTGAMDIDAKTVAELKTMLNRILGAEPEECPESQKVKHFLLDAAEALGIDTAKDLKH